MLKISTHVTWDPVSFFPGMEFLLGDLCSSKTGMPAEERANLELVQYQSESTAALDYCPLQWWAKAAAKCPNLARLARKYNCVPASATPPHRIPQETQVLFDMRRACLGPELVDKLLFLNGNHSVWYVIALFDRHGMDVGEVIQRMGKNHLYDTQNFQSVWPVQFAVSLCSFL